MDGISEELKMEWTRNGHRQIRNNGSTRTKGRYSFYKNRRSLTVNLNAIFLMSQRFSPKLKTDNRLKLKFLEHAISQHKLQNYHQFYNHVHSGLNKYLQDCADVIGYDDMAKRPFGFESF